MEDVGFKSLNNQPNNDGKSPTVPHPSIEVKSVDSSLRENLWNENIIIL